MAALKRPCLSEPPQEHAPARTISPVTNQPKRASCEAEEYHPKYMSHGLTISERQGFESADLSFSHPSGLMRNLDAMVGILLGIMGNTRQDHSTGGTIALQLVGDDPEWFLVLTPQQSAKEPLGGTLIAARLQQNIHDITVL